MAQDAIRTIGMAGGIIALAGLAAWLGLAHSCEKPTGGGVIAGHVSISPDLAQRVSPSDVLFVIVRRPGGMPRPLAVKRVDQPQFPVAFEITNKDVMVEGSELRGMVDVLARIDKDGVAGPPQPGDMEGRYAKNPTLPGARDIEIVIDKAY
ncbi:c-type cytochrome biogenesis protein CcmI/CycH [Candidatus Nitrospira bockiana]